MGIEVLRREEDAVLTLWRQWWLGSSAAQDSRFELLRTTVWSMAATGTKAHVNRVLAVALSTWRLLSRRASIGEEALRGELRGALGALEDVGDLVGLSGGYWAPAAPRVVELPGAAGHLLVGGVPSALLQLDSDAIQFHGPHRHLLTPEKGLTAAFPREDFKSWARLPETPLQDWSHDVINSLERSPYTPAIGEDFEFYTPEKCKPQTSQFFRWSEAPAHMTGTMLARRRRLYGAREYRLVDVRAGQIVGACDLYDIDVRRLMYALDLQAGNPVLARPLRVGSHTEWLFRSELPRAEQRTFAAFGTLTIPDERRYERRWKFLRNEKLALEMLRSLGILFGPPPREARR